LSIFGVTKNENPVPTDEEEFHIPCGGYMFSGHTATMILSTFYLIRYVPKRLFIYDYIFYIWKYGLIFMTGFGMLCLILSREHYTVDVIISYFICTRILTLYHGIAESKYLKSEMRKKYISPLEFEHLVYELSKKSNNDYEPCNQSTNKMFSTNEKFVENDYVENENNRLTSPPYPDRIYNNNQYRKISLSGSLSELKSPEYLLENASIEEFWSYYTTTEFKYLWWAKVILWSECNVDTEFDFIPFEFEWPTVAFTNLVKDVKTELLSKKPREVSLTKSV